MLTVDLDAELERHLNELARRRGVDTVELIRELVVRLVEEEADLRIARERAENPQRRYSLDELERKYGLED
jgi:predicted DNA-binding protein